MYGSVRSELPIGGELVQTYVEAFADAGPDVDVEVRGLGEEAARDLGSRLRGAATACGYPPLAGIRVQVSPDASERGDVMGLGLPALVAALVASGHMRAGDVPDLVYGAIDKRGHVLYANGAEAVAIKAYVEGRTAVVPAWLRVLEGDLDGVMRVESLQALEPRGFVTGPALGWRPEPGALPPWWVTEAFANDLVTICAGDGTTFVPTPGGQDAAVYAIALSCIVDAALPPVVDALEAVRRLSISGGPLRELEREDADLVRHGPMVVAAAEVSFESLVYGGPDFTPGLLHALHHRGILLQASDVEDAPKVAEALGYVARRSYPIRGLGGKAAVQTDARVIVTGPQAVLDAVRQLGASFDLVTDPLSLSPEPAEDHTVPIANVAAAVRDRLGAQTRRRGVRL
jgi:hypothetical protein